MMKRELKRMKSIRTILICILLKSAFITFGQSPGNVSTNLNLWLKANAGVTGTSSVSAWADQSGQGNNAEQSTSSKRPSLTTDAFNFNPAITFDGTDDMLDVPYNANLNGSNVTVFSVHRLNADDNTWRSPFTSRDDYPQRGYIIYVRQDTDQYDLWTGSDSGWDAFTQAILPGADVQVLNVTLNNSPGDKNFYLDGNLESSGSGELYTPNTARPYRVGAGSTETTSGQYFWFGDIAEQIVFNREINADERLRIDTYLAIKYGITLTHDYYNINYDGTNAASTAVYDVDGGYGNDVAGIAQEDAESLNQTKSRSINDNSIVTVTSASDLDDSEYLVWGNDGTSGTTTSDLPVGFDQRLNKVWYFAETGDVGTISIKFDLTKIGGTTTDPNDFALLTNNASATFSSASIHTSGATIVDNILTFTNVEIQDNDYVTLAVSPVGSPGGVASNLMLWLKGDLYTTDIDGITLDLWSDQSGNSNHAEPNPFNRPEIETSSTLNSNAYINFTADNAGQVALASSSEEFEFLSVLRTSTNGSDIFERDDNSNPRLEVENGVYRGNGNGGFVSTSNTGDWHIVGFEQDATTENLYINGIVEDAVTGNITIPSSTNYNLFSDFTGEVAEVIFYEVALNSTNRRKVESYLAIKYGITLDITSQDYVDGSGSSILDRTAFSSYAFNIAGIGKAAAENGDDAQVLNQVQSQSINNTGIVNIGNASGMEDGEYLIWGSNNETALASLTESAPLPSISGVDMILGRKWKVAETGDVGTVTISLDLSSISSVADRELASYSLIIDDNENMSSPTNILKPSSVSSNVITFENVDFSTGDYFVLGTAVSASPGNVSSGLSLWFKAGAGVSTSGSNVTSWVDQSPTGLDLNSQNGDPTMSAAAINSNSAVAFDGNDNVYNSGTYDTENLLSGGALTGQHTFYIVAQHTAANPSARNVFFSNGSDQFRQGLHTNPRVHIRESGSANNNVSPGSINIDNPNIYVIKRTSNNTTGGGTLYINGVTVTNYNTGNGVTDDTKIVIGGENDANGSNGWVGNIAEVIAFATSEDDTDRQKIETYLAIKYGITLSSNYLATSGSPIYNVSNGYANDIAGIGREDDELLAQTQSKSENSDAIITISNAAELDDAEYLIWGNDDGATTETTSGLPSGVNQMLTRKWSTTETGDVKGVQIQFDLTGLTVTGTTANDFSLIVDGDATFNDGDEILFTADDFSANIVTFNSIDLSDGAVFSLATSVSSNLVEIASSVGDYEVTSSCPVLSGNSYIDVRDSNNRLVYSINPNGNDLGATCWGVRIRASGSSSDDLVNNEDYYLDRNFYITPTTQPSSNVSIRFYVLSDEIDDIRNRLTTDGKSSGNDVAEYLQDFLRITKQEGSDLDPLTSAGSSQVFAPTIAAYGSSGYTIEVSVGSFSEFLPGTDSEDSNSSLPVDLLYFTAEVESEGVNLSWATASEINNDYFTIERSRDGKHFETIEEIYGAGNSNETIVYESVDYSPFSGQSYYRLKQTDFDGTFSYSEIVMIERQSHTEPFGISYYPNPVKNHLNIELSTSLFDADYRLEVFTLNGSPVQVSSIQENDHLIRLDTSSLFSGMYVVRLTTGGHVSFARFTK
ncbi:MAG: LamG-like jellyroll fold domain-containing protein [Reichenbachiella sp.]|uniref:T9SS type A sorting domain-containing protein n=3 Tax=Reichenbachiella sp. TaxID=2184521 RepID=UPI003263F593